MQLTIAIIATFVSVYIALMAIMANNTLAIGGVYVFVLSITAQCADDYKKNNAYYNH